MAALLPLLLALQAAPVATSPSDPLPGDWRAIPDDELLVMTLTGGRTITIRLAAADAPEHVANVRALARARWWDATSVYRVQDNWVVQWGGAPTDAEEKPLPPGVAARPAAEYDLAGGFRPAQRLARSDAYSAISGITADGWAVAGDRAGAGWLAHCYGTIGVARDAAPDTGSGGELFMPLGGSARRLDRNYTIVGRVIDGAGYLSGLPRSGAAMGVYAAAIERTPIVSARLASDLPAATRPHWQYRAADNLRFAAAIALREHPKTGVALGGVDVCDVPLAVRGAE
ncbi:MAG: peptidylprolyl isomerase [Janthinobacterium lividum]